MLLKKHVNERVQVCGNGGISRETLIPFKEREKKAMQLPSRFLSYWKKGGLLKEEGYKSKRTYKQKEDNQYRETAWVYIRKGGCASYEGEGRLGFKSRKESNLFKRE